MDYFTVLTNEGAAKIAAATAANTTVELTHIAVGDGNGSVPTPDITQTALVNEMYRTTLSELKVDETNANHFIARSVVPAEEGNFWIREIGVFDADGDLIAVGNYPETYKSVLTDGAAKEIDLIVVFQVANTEVVELTLDPTVVMASQDHVEEKIDEVKLYVNNEIDKLGLPVGTQSFEIIETPRPNQLVQLGGEFLRADYPALWTFIQTQTNLLLTEVEWQTENTENGMCGKFSSGDGSTTFRLMNLDQAFLRAVDGVTDTVGRFESDEFKSHNHPTNNELLFQVGTSRYGWYSGGSGTTYNSGDAGGDETRPKNIGALPLIVAA